MFMIVNFEQFLNEGFFNFLKKEDNNFQYVPIRASLIPFVNIWKEENINPDTLQQIQDDINEFNQIGIPQTHELGKRKIILFLKIKERKKSINLRAYLAFAIENLIGKEIKIKRKKILVRSVNYQEHRLSRISQNIYDDYNIVFNSRIFVPLDEFPSIKIKQEINRVISKVDPYGEETWEDENLKI